MTPLRRYRLYGFDGELEATGSFTVVWYIEEGLLFREVLQMTRCVIVLEYGPSSYPIVFV